ncbi:unnamed protein product [Adineta ricciae]|uniref:Uncharacterized protein n=1 Tax=Adineta ricciae TaxID=249248 RepID=A0A813QII6_ADIRI|nr:unnamed protein product [Adineta ricciae]
MEAPSIESIPQMINQDDAEAMVPCTSMNSLLDDENIEQEKRIKTPKRPRPIKSAASQFSTKTIERTSKTDLAPSKTDDRPVTRNCVTVDTSKARSNLDVVRMCIRELRWKECPFPSASDSDIYWHSQTFHEGNANFASSSGRVNKFPDGSQGEGIYLFRDPAHCTVTSRPHVVQEYIDRPLLMNGLKFDLRIYALILNLYPLEIFLYDEGLVRFATVHYDAPSTDNLHQTYMHLTNYSLNKRSSNYKHVVDSQQTDGSKRKLSTVWTQLICSYGNVRIEEVKLSITEMVNKTILAILPNLRVEYELEIPLTRKQSLSCFQIVGFDIILTNELKPVLLEVNANPSLRIDFDKENEMGKIIYHASPIDEEIKRPLILETLKLALPKKRLQTFTRHAQIQVKDELLIQRLERVAQRRIDERNERFKSARNTRFDIKRNPYFSRPLPTRKSKECEDTISIESPHELLLSADKQIIHARVTSKGQRGRSATVARHSMMKSAASRPRSPPRFNSPKRLQLIYPSSDKTKYQHLVLIDKIAYIYIHFVVIHGDKTMSNAQFRTFANTCGIIDEIITASSIDILYYQIVRKWQQFVSRVPVSGLPFSAFVEVMFLLSQRKYTNASSLLDSVYELVNICIRNLKSYFQTPASQQQQQRSIRNNRTVPKQTTKSIFPLFFDVL